VANRAVKLKNGRKLDQELIDKLASEAERGGGCSAIQFSSRTWRSRRANASG
jgi:hypothetical protein